jgi:type IV pilus assembly protein PilC
MYCVYFGLLLVALVVSGFATWLRLRQQRIGVVVQTLAGIVSQNLPLVPAVQAAARPERRALRKIYARLAEYLAAGQPLSTALRCAVPACPGELVGALQGAERGGTLPGVLQSLAERVRREVWLPPARGLPTWYPLVLLVAVPGAVAFLFVVILPKFREIFDDFGVHLPQITQMLFAIAQPVIDNGALILIAVLVIGLALVQGLIGRHFFPRLPDRWQPLFFLRDTLVWCIPGLRQRSQSYALSQQLIVMHAALRAGHDLGEAARQAASVAVNFYARHRLSRWAVALDQGNDPRIAAIRLGLPAPFVQALGAARPEGELATRLEYLADYYCILHHHWMRTVAAVATPLMVMAWGLIIGFVILAFFLPLVMLIEGVLQSIG